MEQTDIQFKAFIRFMLDVLRDIAAEENPEKKKAKTDRVIENLQKILED